MPTLEQFQQRVDKVVQDAGALLVADARDAFIEQAITQRYSKDRPIEKVTDVNGNGTALVAVPSGWEDGFSRLDDSEGIEYPNGNVPPTHLEADEWRMYREPGALKIMLLAAKPTASEVIRLKWTARHSADGTTVPAHDFEAVADYAASLAFAALAAKHAQTGDATLSADTVNYRSKQQEFSALARAAAKRYYEHLGIDPEKPEGGGPALAIGETDLDIGGTGVDRLTHPARTR